MESQMITTEYTEVTEKSGPVFEFDFSVTSVYSVVKLFKLADYKLADSSCSISLR